MPDINGIPYVESDDLVSAYPAVSQSLAQEVSDQLASKLPYAFSDTEPTTTVDGFLWYDDNETPPAPKFWDGAAFQALTSGKILQVVRATDSTNRSTTSTSFVDITGMSVTISPQKSDSAILLVCIFNVVFLSAAGFGYFQITDASNNVVSGAEDMRFGSTTANTKTASHILLGYATPATTSATTYKLRSKSETGSSVTANNGTNTGQVYAIEVSA